MLSVTHADRYLKKGEREKKSGWPSTNLVVEKNSIFSVSVSKRVNCFYTNYNRSIFLENYQKKTSRLATPPPFGALEKIFHLVVACFFLSSFWERAVIFK